MLAPLVLEACEVDLRRQLVLRGRETTPLTTKETQVLAYLAARPGAVVPREELLREIWSYGRIPATQPRPDATIVCNLRDKIELDRRHPRHLFTVTGVGYRFEPLNGDATHAPSVASPAPAPEVPPVGAPYDEATHAPRRADEADIASLLRAPGAPVVLVGPRRIGKSWLLGRALATQAGVGDRVALVRIDTLPERTRREPSALWGALAAEMARATGIEEPELGEAPRRSIDEWMERRLLPSVPERLLLAIDGADALRLDPDPSEVMGLLRAWLCRGRRPWDRLRLLLTVSTNPAVLVPDARLSPFNLAPPLMISDLDEAGVEALAITHGLAQQAADVDLRSLCGGHPYLLRLLFRHARLSGRALREVLPRAAHDEGPLGEHLRGTFVRVAADPEVRGALAAILAGNTAPIPWSVADRLASAGLVAWDGERWVMRYGVYAAYLRGRL